MKTAVIMDVLVAAALLWFLARGARRGLVQAVAGLLITVLALGGAGIASRALTPTVTELLSPVIQERVADRVGIALEDEAQTPASPGELDDLLTRLQASELLKLMGLDENVTDALAEKVEEKVRETGETIATAVVESLMESVVYAVLFLLLFIVLTVVLRLALDALNLVMKLPGLHLLNGLGGAAVGLLQGVLVLFLAAFLIRWLNVPLDAQAVSETKLLHFFMTYSPLDLLSY